MFHFRKPLAPHINLHMILFDAYMGILHHAQVGERHCHSLSWIQGCHTSIRLLSKSQGCFSNHKKASYIQTTLTRSLRCSCMYVICIRDIYISALANIHYSFDVAGSVLGWAEICFWACSYICIGSFLFYSL